MNYQKKRIVYVLLATGYFAITLFLYGLYIVLFVRFTDVFDVFDLPFLAGFIFFIIQAILFFLPFIFIILIYGHIEKKWMPKRTKIIYEQEERN